MQFLFFLFNLVSGGGESYGGQDAISVSQKILLIFNFSFTSGGGESYGGQDAISVGE
jgi:hypothetical protein